MCQFFLYYIQVCATAWYYSHSFICSMKHQYGIYTFSQDKQQKNIGKHKKEMKKKLKQVKSNDIFTYLSMAWFNDERTQHEVPKPIIFPFDNNEWFFIFTFLFVYSLTSLLFNFLSIIRFHISNQSKDTLLYLFCITLFFISENHSYIKNNNDEEGKKKYRNQEYFIRLTIILQRLSYQVHRA